MLQLPQLSSLSYEGPADRRTPGLDITSALAAVAAVAANRRSSSSNTQAPAGPSPPPPSDVLQHKHNTCTVQLQHQQHLTRLELRAGRLPDSLVEVVGKLSSLQSLRLTATTAVATAPLAQLNRLSQLALTVTPPLAGALAPLAGLRQLAVLHLAAISPARGWGSALQLLQVRHTCDVQWDVFAKFMFNILAIHAVLQMWCCACGDVLPVACSSDSHPSTCSPT